MKGLILNLSKHLKNIVALIKSTDTVALY